MASPPFQCGARRTDASSAVIETNEELATTSRAPRQAQEAKDRFIATLSHELRNPLAAVQAATDLLALDIPSDHPAIAVLHRQITALNTVSGLGLGLAIVRGIVGLHGGTVSAHSDGTGTGAEFRVVLPLTTAGPHETEEPPRLTARPPLRILERRFRPSPGQASGLSDLDHLLGQWTT